MPGDDLAKVTPGEPLLPRMTASTFNAVMDATGFFRAMQQSGGARTRPWPRQAGVVYIRNDSGEDRNQFDILGIDGPLSTPTECEEEFRLCRCLSGVAPYFATHFGRFAVLMDAIPDGEIGRAVIDGITPCLVRTKAESDGFADLDVIGEPNSTYLRTRTASGGAQILWKESGTGEVTRWAIVRLAPPAFGVRWGKVQAGYANFTGSGVNTVPATTASIKLLDDYGTEMGSAFSINLVFAEGMAPNLAAGDVVPFSQECPSGGGLIPECLNCRPDLGYGRIIPIYLGGSDLAYGYTRRGWAVCDGNNGTPDLSDLFLMATNNALQPGQTGGYADHGNGTNDHYDHLLDTIEIATESGAQPVVTGPTTLEHSATDNRPPFFKVRMMMRVS